MSPISPLAFALLFIALSSPSFAAGPQDSAKIKRCQDAAGKWHYGDYAADECAKSKIDVLSGQGVKQKEIAAPPTAAEIAERERHKEELAREKLSAEEQAKRDQVLLQSYPREDDMVIYRDRKLSQLDGSIKSNDETLKSLRKVLERLDVQHQSETEKNDKKGLMQTDKSIAQTKSQIAKQETAIQQTRHEQERLRKQFDTDLVRYRELKLQQQQQSKAAPKNSAAQ